MNTLVRYKFKLPNSTDEQRFVGIVGELESKLQLKALSLAEGGGKHFEHESELRELTEALITLLGCSGLSTRDLEPVLYVWNCSAGDGIQLELLFPDDAQNNASIFLGALNKMNALDVAPPQFKAISDEELIAGK